MGKFGQDIGRFNMFSVRALGTTLCRSACQQTGVSLGLRQQLRAKISLQNAFKGVVIKRCSGTVVGGVATAAASSGTAATPRICDVRFPEIIEGSIASTSGQ